MCGIAGCFDRNCDPAEQVDFITAMIKSMKHRGPDAEGLKVLSKSPAVILGHVRLSIIDLSVEGGQPMDDDLSGNTIAYNGEIYNFKLLKKELETAGQKFKTLSDTEVILKSFNEWGSDCCKKLNGIYSFAIWIKKTGKLFIARDQMGVKPFYYSESSERFIFASEVRALLASGKVQRKLDPAGLESFLAYGSVQEPFTLIDGVKSLPPGYYGYYDKYEGLKLTRFWNPGSDLVKNLSNDLVGLVPQTLRETLKNQLISDVPLGIFLSGGIDSSSLVSLVRQLDSSPIKTFSIVFEDPKFDERRFARLVANRNGTDHIELELTSALIKDNLRKALCDFDQPSVDGLNTWYVSKLVKESGLTVALSGVGGDELFIGYNGFRKPLLMQRIQHLLGSFPHSASSTLQKISSNEYLRKTGDLMGFKYPGYFASRKLFSETQVSEFLSQSLISDNKWFVKCFDSVISDGKFFNDEISRISFYELKTYMLSTLLRDTDQMSMAHSLEIRVPLIDPLVVNLLLSISGYDKKSKEIPKHLLVNAASDGLPPECVNRKKQGFGFPFDHYFADSIGQEITEIFNENSLSVFKDNSLNKLWTGYCKGYVSWSRIWAIFVLLWWMKNNGVTE